MTTDPPTLGEVIRRLDALQITTTAMLTTLQTQYVSREYLALKLDPINEKLEAQGKDIDEIQQEGKDRVKSDAAWRKSLLLVVLAFGLASLSALVAWVTPLLMT